MSKSRANNRSAFSRLPEEEDFEGSKWLLGCSAKFYFSFLFSFLVSLDPLFKLQHLLDLLLSSRLVSSWRQCFVAPQKEPAESFQVNSLPGCSKVSHEHSGYILKLERKMAPKSRQVKTRRGNSKIEVE